MFGMGTMELLFIALIFVLLFGAKKIPEVARSLGGAVSEFKKGMRGGVDELKKEIDAPAGDDKPADKS
jgi:sec-independent protein translocase protein TatA